MRTLIAHATRASRMRVLITLAVGLAFLLLVSVSAAHIHFKAVDEDGCSICAVVVGGLHSPPALQIAPPPRLPPLATRAHVDTTFIGGTLQAARPPSCGPPKSA